VRVRRVGVLQRTLSRSWTLTVDTTAPSARLVAPVDDREDASAYAPAGTAVVTKLPVTVTVDAEAGSTVEVASDAQDADATTLEASDEARRSVDVSLPQGAQQLVVRVRDAAGNVSERRQALLVDTAGPALALRAPRLVRSAALDLPVTARDPHGVDVTVELDGHVQEDALDAQSTTPAPNEGGTGDADDEGAGSGGGSPAATVPCSDEDDESCHEQALPIAERAVLALQDGAYEGRHALKVVARDSLGNERTITRTVIVDSTEQLGEATGLRTGARGADVLALHDALLKAGATTSAKLAADARVRTYGSATRAAVQAFQSARGVEADGIAGPDTIAALTLKIVVDRSSKQLTLYRLGNVVKTWGVAVGSPEYPTPAGSFKIQSMQKDPTWTPPDSAWAKDAKPIGPGPDNPLGTRWMAIDGTVGIHGTNNPASIGYSVSHGCIRMRIPDVEELFELVQIGTPVTVV
jgi:lipoprotein-anchoring transpeptidase ErfK/SrfK